MSTLKKEVIIEVIQSQTEGQTKKGANEEIKKLDELIVALVEKLEVGDKIKVGEYFTIAKTHKEATTARNPKTGEEIAVLAKDVVVIKATDAGKKLA